MKFKKIRGLKMPYERQGMIFFTLANYKEQPPEMRERIDEMIAEVCGGDAAYENALRAWLIKGEDFESVHLRYYVNAATLGRLRRRIYERW